MNDDYNKNPHFKFELFSGKWWRILGIAVVLLIFAAIKACSQEKAKTVSVEKVHRYGTKYRVCVQTDSGKRYSVKWNAHTYYSKNVRIPQEWSVITKRRKSFIEPIK